MGRHTFIESMRHSAEGQAQALRHAKDALDRSAWFLALLRRDLKEVPRTGYIRRLQMRGLLAGLEIQQASLSSSYFEMAAIPPGKLSDMQLKHFYAAYDRFLDGVRVARRDSRKDCEMAAAASSADPFRIRCGLPSEVAHDQAGGAVPVDDA